MPVQFAADRVADDLLLQDLSTIVASVFETMLNLEAAVADDPWFPSNDRLTAVVNVAGIWNGSVIIEFDRAQACRLTGRFLSTESPVAVDDVVRDVLGELANMIGGNLKSMLSPLSRISLPVVIDGFDYCWRIYGGAFPRRLAFVSSEGPFWVSAVGADREKK